MSRRSLFGALARGALVAGLALFCLFIGLLIYDSVAPPVSTLMLGRKIEGKGYERDYVRLKDIAPIAVASVIDPAPTPEITGGPSVANVISALSTPAGACAFFATTRKW